MKRNSLIRISIVLVLLGCIARYGLISMNSVSSEQGREAPDKHHRVKVSNKWRKAFWTGAAREHYAITIESADGRVIRRVVINEPWTGWPKDGKIQWATDSQSVFLTFKAEEARKTHLVLQVGQ